MDDLIKYNLGQIAAIYSFYHDDLSLKRVKSYIIKQKCVVKVKSKKTEQEKFSFYVPVATLDDGTEIPVLQIGHRELVELEDNLLKSKADSKQLSKMLNDLIALVN